MSFTVSTVPFLALLVVLYFVAKKQWFPVLLFTNIFQGAALVIVGSGASGVSLAPSQAALLMLLLQKAMAKPKEVGPRLVAQKNVTAVLLMYGAYAILTAIFCPFFFQGIPVSNPRNGMGAPLNWGMYNVTQSIYLLIGITVQWLCVHRSDFEEMKKALDWYLAGATFAAFLAIYQSVAFSTGLPFPSDLLHSNTQYVIFEAYEMSGFTRVNSTFTEAAAAAGCFAAALGLVIWRVLFVEFNAKLLVSLVALLTGLILTRSSSGYLGLSFIVVAAAVLFLKKAIVSRQVQMFRTGFAIVVLLVSVSVFLQPQVRTEIGSLLDMVLFTKTQSASYVERTAWNQAALAAGSQTWWIGAGWGSLRASSLVANILGTVGIPGLLLFITFCGLTIRLASKGPADASQMQKSVMLPIFISLIDCVLAGPEMTDTSIWFFLGVAAFVNYPALRNNTGRVVQYFNTNPKHPKEFGVALS